MVNDLGNTDDLELMPTGGGYMVRRDRLMNELLSLIHISEPTRH